MILIWLYWLGWVRSRHSFTGPTPESYIRISCSRGQRNQQEPKINLSHIATWSRIVWYIPAVYRFKQILATVISVYLTVLAVLWDTQRLLRRLYMSLSGLKNETFLNLIWYRHSAKITGIRSSLLLDVKSHWFFFLHLPLLSNLIIIWRLSSILRETFVLNKQAESRFFPA